MQKQWISTTEMLPEDGEAVSFLIDNHCVWMAGTYRLGFFESHWGTYDAGAVRGWHSLEHGKAGLTERARLA